MSDLKQRLERLKKGLAVRLDEAPQAPASERWLKVLRLFLPPLERYAADTGQNDTLLRVQRSIAYVEQYLAGGEACAHLEYYLGICCDRLNWRSNGWEHHWFAPAEPGYEEHLRQIEEIRQAQRQPPVPLELG